MDGRIMCCGIISSRQSAATSETVKRSWACVHRAAVLYQVPDLYRLPLPLYHEQWHKRNTICLHKPSTIIISLWHTSGQTTVSECNKPARKWWQCGFLNQTHQQWMSLMPVLGSHLKLFTNQQSTNKSSTSSTTFTCSSSSSSSSKML